MNPKHAILNTFLIGLLFFALPGVTTGKTKLTSTQIDDQYKGGPLKSVMVVAVSEKPKNRKIFEDAFVKQYQGYEVKAVSSLSVIPSDKKLDKGLVMAAAEKLGVGHIFVVHLMSIEKKTEEIPIAITGSGGRTGIYIPSHRYNMPGMEIKQTRVKLKSRLFEFKTEKLIWSATSESFDPKSAKDIVGPLCRLVMKSMQKNKLLK